MSTMFEESPELRRLAEQIIDQHHEHLEDAKSLIGFYLRSGSADWAGKAKKCTAFERHVTGYLLFVFINAGAWEGLNQKQQRALMDHELCHFTRTFHQEVNELGGWKSVWDDANDPDNWGIRDHDVEEFSDVIRRHGLWEQGIEKFAVAVRTADYQASIFDPDVEENSNVTRMNRAVR